MIESVQGLDLVQEINKLRVQKNAVILAHNYQIPEVQDIADFVADSLGLAYAAEESTAETIVLCGVEFMAETASLLCPDKIVLLPDTQAGCSLAQSITGEQLADWKRQYPEAVVVCYVNTSAEVKSLSDYCCTSTNAVQVVESIPEDQEILFVPDMFLGAYVKKKTGRKNIRVWMGECHVHAGISEESISTARKEHPKAEFLVHPECGCISSTMYLTAENGKGTHDARILSTGGMIKHAKTSSSKEFVIATETGILHRLEKDNPEKSFFPVSRANICHFMKMITLEKVYRSLKEGVHRVTVDESIAAKARIPINRMLDLQRTSSAPNK